VDLVSPPGQMPLGREKDDHAGADETGPSGLPNRTVWFALFQTGASGSCSFHVRTHFCDSAGESTTSSTSSMKSGNSGTNRSDLDKNNILKPTFDTLTEEGCKAFCNTLIFGRK
jgi:hypothetical protein